ncbi:MAG: creatininase family protein [Hungatella hathewayi]|nr:creatininase family protein [Hungatella hathewayi]
MRTRILPKMLNTEVEQYLERNDVIIVPVGTVELHGGFPLDSETVISEAFALKMAEAADGLVLTGLPYFYAGATAMARGTTQVSVREGIDYLGAIARSLLRQGFKRQIYISFHGPAHMTCSPMVRDFFDETGVPILYMDLTMQMMKEAKDLFKSLDAFHAITVAAYDIMGRLEDIPLTTEYFHQDPQTVEQFNGLFGLAYQSGSIGYCFGDQKDHMSTTAVPTEERRRELAEEGRPVIEEIVNRIHMEKVVADMRDLEKFQLEAMEKYPWMPAAYNRGK